MMVQSHQLTVSNFIDTYLLARVSNFSMPAPTLNFQSATNFGSHDPATTMRNFVPHDPAAAMVLAPPNIYSQPSGLSFTPNEGTKFASFEQDDAHFTYNGMGFTSQTYPTFIETYTLDIQPDLFATTTSTATSSGMFNFGLHNDGQSASAPLTTAVRRARPSRAKSAVVGPASSTRAVQRAGPSRDKSAAMVSVPSALSPEDAMRLAAFFGPLGEPKSERFMLL